jgi:UDP-glucose 4-epimerase
MHNILVVGGAGFIGSQLVDSLLTAGNKVIAIDNLFRGKKENLALASKNPNFSFEFGDANNQVFVSSVLRKYSIEFVFHLAANSDIQASAMDPSIEFRNTASTTWSVLSAMRDCGVKNFFFTSTSAVYGELKGSNFFSEDSSLLNPISYYGAAKAASEAFIHSFAYMNKMNALIFRLPNVIGRRLTHGVIFDFISRLKQNPNKLEVLGDGNQSKPYLHCDDLLRAILLLYPLNNGTNIYLVGVDSSTSVKKIAEMVVSEMKLSGKCEIVFEKKKTGWEGDVPHFAYNLDKIHSMGWHASMSSDEAVLLTIQEAISNGF